MSSIAVALVTAVALLVALAVASGLELAQDRAEARLIAIRKKILESHHSGRTDGPQRYCSICCAQLVPPAPPVI
jgi:hypothetical protein